MKKREQQVAAAAAAAALNRVNRFINYFLRLVY